MTDVRIPLNPQVAEELSSNWELWLVFSATFSGYDWEIDPMHRTAWVEETKKQEAKMLEEAKVKLVALKQAHEAIQQHVAR